MALVAHSFAASPYMFTGQQTTDNPNTAANLGAMSSRYNGFGSLPLNFGFPAYYSYPTGLLPSPPAAASGFGFDVPSDDVFTVGIRQALIQAGFTGSEYPSPLASFNPITGYPVATTIPRYQSIPQLQPVPMAVTSTTEINPTGIDFKALQFIATPPIPKTLPADKDQRVITSQNVHTNAPPQNGRLLNSNGIQYRYPVKDESKIRVSQETAAAVSSTTYPNLDDITTQSISSFTSTHRPSISNLILELKPPASLSNAQSFEYLGNQNSSSSLPSSSAFSQTSNNYNIGSDNYNSNTGLTTTTTVNPLPSDSYSISGSSYRAADSVFGGANSLRTPSYSSVPSISYTLPDYSYRPSSGTANVQNLVSKNVFFNNYRGSDPAQPVAQYISSIPFSKSPPNSNNNYYNVPNPVPNNNQYSDAYHSSSGDHIAPNQIANPAIFNNQVIQGFNPGQPIVPYSSSIPAVSGNVQNPNNNYYNNVLNLAVSSNQHSGTNSPVSSVSFRILNSVPANPYKSPNSIQNGVSNTPGYYPYNSPK